MTDTPPDHKPTQPPVEPLYTHPASPFMRTESNLPPQVAGIPGPTPPAMKVQSTWSTRRWEIEFGLAMLAYLMLLIGSVTLLHANPGASWRYIVAVVPVVPAGLMVYLLYALLRPEKF